MPKLSPCLWFDREAEDAAKLDCAIPGLGLSWQVVPAQPAKLMARLDREVGGRIAAATMQMARLDIAKPDAAAAG